MRIDRDTPVWLVDDVSPRQVVRDSVVVPFDAEVEIDRLVMPADPETQPTTHLPSEDQVRVVRGFQIGAVAVVVVYRRRRHEVGQARACVHVGLERAGREDEFRADPAEADAVRGRQLRADSAGVLAVSHALYSVDDRAYVAAEPEVSTRCHGWRLLGQFGDGRFSRE